MKGVLLAQTMLSRQATKKRQAQQRCFRERRGKSMRGYTSYGEYLSLITFPIIKLPKLSFSLWLCTLAHWSLVLCISGRRGDGKKSEGPAYIQANATKCLLGWVWGTDSGRKGTAAAKSTADWPKRGRHEWQPLMANGIRPEVEDQKCEGLGKESQHKDPHTPKSITNLDPQLIETVQRFCNTNMKLPWLEGTWGETSWIWKPV